MTKEVPACCICQSQELTVHLTGEQHSLHGASFGSSRTKFSVGNVLRCQTCGFGFSQLRPSEDRLGELYRELDIEAYEAENHGRFITARRNLSILHQFRRPPGRLLDVGCASGRFLREAFVSGWEITGIEPSDSLFRIAKASLTGQATLFQSTLQEAELPERSYDAITMWDVVEHVPDPISFLRIASRLLQPMGFLILNVPNLDSWQARVLRRRWPLILPEHLNYFNKSSLRRAAEAVGLRLVSFGSRPAAFSFQYIAHRLRQHRIPAAGSLERLAVNSVLGKWVIPIYLGELCAAFVMP
jgi:ubiquinone/menaquinone biosynthesis C-methylase UbiE